MLNTIKSCLNFPFACLSKLKSLQPKEVDSRIHSVTIDMLNACFSIAKDNVINPGAFKYTGHEIFRANFHTWKKYVPLYPTDYRNKLENIIDLTAVHKKEMSKLALIGCVAFAVLFSLSFLLISALGASVLVSGVSGSLFAGMGSVYFGGTYYLRKSSEVLNESSSTILLEINSLENNEEYVKHKDLFKKF